MICRHRSLRTGKSHLAVSLGLEAVRAGKSVFFSTLADIVTALANAEHAGQLKERLTFYARNSLLIIDEIGYLPLQSGGANLFFQLINARYERGALILTSNRGFRLITLLTWGNLLCPKWENYFAVDKRLNKLALSPRAMATAAMDTPGCWHAAIAIMYGRAASCSCTSSRIAP